MSDSLIIPAIGHKLATIRRGDVHHMQVAIGAGDSALFAPFGRLRTADQFTIFDSKLLTSDKQPLFWDEAAESGSGVSSSTPTAEKPYIDLVSTTNMACVFTRQTFMRFAYQPGKGHLIEMTGVLGLSGGGVGVQRRIGYFDNNNGAFLVTII